MADTNNNRSGSGRAYGPQDAAEAISANDETGPISNEERLTRYATWLVQNKDKSGTPEFETVAQAYRQLRTSGAASGPDTSMTSALKQSFAQPLEGVAESLEQIGKVADAPVLKSTGEKLKDALPAPTNYQSATERLAHPEARDKTVAGFGYEYLPRAAVEQVGGLAGSLAARGIGAAALAPLGPEASAAGAIAGPAAFGTLATLGPTVLARAQKNGHETPTWDDWAVAATSAGLQGLLESIGVKGLGKLNSSIAGAVSRQVLTNAAQSAVQQGAETVGTDEGLSVDPKLALAQGLASGVAGGTVEASSKAVRGVNPPPAVRDAQAAARLATRLKSIADENGLDLTDTGSGMDGARAAVGKAHTQITEGIKALVTTLRPELGEDPAVKAAINDARRKAGLVTDRELTAVADKVGDTDEGQQLLSLLREKAVLAKVVHLAGKTGGLSSALERFQPRVLTKPLTVAGALAAGTALPQYALPAALALGASYGVARAVDAATGRRYPLNRFVQSYAKYESPEGMSSPGLPSVLAQRRARQAQGGQDEIVDRLKKLAASQRVSELVRANQLADIVPAGGWGRRIYDNLGLTPREFEKGLNILSNEHGLLTRDEVSRAVDDPTSLMASKLGLAIEDRLNHLISEGRLARAKGWMPQGSGNGIEDPSVNRPLAYQGAIDLHNATVLRTDEQIRASGMSPETIEATRRGLFALSKARSKAEARQAIADAARSLRDPSHRGYVFATLGPLVSLKTKD